MYFTGQKCENALVHFWSLDLKNQTSCLLFAYKNDSQVCNKLPRFFKIQNTGAVQSDKWSHQATPHVVGLVKIGWKIEFNQN